MFWSPVFIDLLKSPKNSVTTEDVKLRTLFPWIVIFLILTVGVIADISVHNGFCLLIVEDLRDFTKTLLGIQATVAVLSLSILTLLGSFMDKSYWGISISDFYSNKKNPAFTSLFVIVLGLVFILLDILSIFLKLYNLTIMIFVETVFIILWATANVYYVFKGDRAIKKDIENMFETTFKSEGHLDSKMDLFTVYCSEWKSLAQEQSEIDFQEYKVNFSKFFWILIKQQNSNTIKTVCNILQDFVRALLISSKEPKKKQGIQLLEEIYRSMRYLDKSQFENTEFLKEFALISEVKQEFLEALQNLSTDWVKENFPWYSFIGDIDTLAITFETKAKFQELAASLQISLQIGLL